MQKKVFDSSIWIPLVFTTTRFLLHLFCSFFKLLVFLLHCSILDAYYWVQWRIVGKLALFFCFSLGSLLLEIPFHPFYFFFFLLLTSNWLESAFIWNFRLILSQNSWHEQQDNKKILFCWTHSLEKSLKSSDYQKSHKSALFQINQTVNTENYQQKKNERFFRNFSEKPIPLL